MKGGCIQLAGLAAVFLLNGCGLYHRQGLDAAHLCQVERDLPTGKARFSPDFEKKILSLDPTMSRPGMSTTYSRMRRRPEW